MRLTGALGMGETLPAVELAAGLSALNAMLDEWSNNGLTVSRRTRLNFSWAASQQTRTIGPTGDFVADRPRRLEHAFQRVNSTDTPIGLVEEDEYSSLSSKSITGNMIRCMWMDPTTPNATLYAWPVPNTTLDVHLAFLGDIQTFDNASEEMDLPDGYQTAIEYNLAIELAPEFQVQVPASVERRAFSSKRALKRTNTRIPMMRVDPTLISGRRYDIRTGR